MPDPVPGESAEDGERRPAIHEGEISLGAAINRGIGPPSGLLTARVARYPGCQQLVLWLPRPGHAGYGELTVRERANGVRERAPVTSRLSGSVQILFDTLAWPPGEYDIEVAHRDGWRHSIAVRKWPPGLMGNTAGAVDGGQIAAGAVAADSEAADADAAEVRAPIVYRDGFGQVLPDADLELREHALAALARRFARRLRYEGSLRAGVIVYEEGDVRIRFAQEMADGAGRFTIELPDAGQWEGVTGALLSDRDDIVSFVAQRVQREQAGGWRYEITPRAINFYQEAPGRSATACCAPTLAPNSGPSS